MMRKGDNGEREYRDNANLELRKILRDDTHVSLLLLAVAYLAIHS